MYLSPLLQGGAKEQVLSIRYLYRSQIKGGSISSSVINVTINESKKEMCKKCKLFSNCNYSNNIFVDFKTTFDNTDKTTILKKIIIRKLLLNKKYGCLKNIKKISKNAQKLLKKYNFCAFFCEKLLLTNSNKCAIIVGA
jgi:hypothetical protein